MWDTVGALGIPLTGLPLVDAINNRWRFHDTDLSSAVDGAFQALAIDEHTRLFRPTLCTTQKHAPKHQRVEQVWFAGCHSDVGGGFRDHGLSDIALTWMVNRSREYGLAFTFEATLPDEEPSAATAVVPNPFGLLHSGPTGIFRFLPHGYLRSLGTTDKAHEYLASSAGRRHRELPDYAPSNLLAYLERGGQVVSVLPARPARLIRDLVAGRNGS